MGARHRPPTAIAGRGALARWGGRPAARKFGWQAWAEPVVGGPCLWCASFSSSAPHDLLPRLPLRIPCSAPACPPESRAS
ncbi:DUF317 domain-containing protein [Streptomyces fradiae]|uniref:DUF317 domain-containing protein n=1 Tax=Streptomyces fradiae TaxID=1906 RepID=UPI0035BE61D3